MKKKPVIKPVKKVPPLASEDKSLKDQILGKVSIDIMKDVEGRILEILITEMGVKYSVRYIDDTYVVVEWFYRDELTFI